MGKPFTQELSKIQSVLDWASSTDIKRLSSFLLHENSHCVIVGSGGSISASYLLANLLHSKGRTCQVVTPFELYHNQQILSDAQVLLISASGRNKDILFALKTAISQEPHSVGCLTMSVDSPLSKLARNYSICESFEFAIPTRKDGFLATNSLVGTWALLLRAVENLDTEAWSSLASNLQASTAEQLLFANPELSTLVVLYGKWGKPIAIDIESKCTEAGLVTVQLADFRNFGHGRHHWLAKHSKTTAIVSIVAPSDTELYDATIALIPDDIPCFLISADSEGLTLYLDLLIKSFTFIKALGDFCQIDPGQPGVPEFGRRLYHLNPATYLSLSKLSRKQLAIRRKIRSFEHNYFPSPEVEAEVANAFDQFVESINKAKFGSIIVDYDGTIGSKIEKHKSLSDPIVEALLIHLSRGFIIGIATGRGKSALHSLRSIIPSEYWPRILIGYYNGTFIRPLTEDLTDMSVGLAPQFQEVIDYLNSLSFPKTRIEARTHQITVDVDTESQKIATLNLLQSFFKANQVTGLYLSTSGNCIDVTLSSDGSKINVVKACQQLAVEYRLATECLCVGDQGRYPGNDFTMLSTPYSLSVDEISPLLSTCWNLASLGQRNVLAMSEYFSAITYHSTHFKFKTPK